MDAKLKRLSRENPWPGLDSFGEEDFGFFHGRDAETSNLLRLVKRELLTLLFGRSGLGKTSILNAGLFPLLREQGFVPVYLRLDFSGLGPTLRSQILMAVNSECAARNIEAPKFDEGITLWESFHRRDCEFWSEKNRPVTPVVVLDQFEEAFTLGIEDFNARSLVKEFLAELGDLIENRPPKHIKESLDANPDLDLGLDFRKSDFKLILSFREDYLPHIEELKREIPSLTYNRYRLLPMSGMQAKDVVLIGGGDLVSETVAVQIIGIAAGVHELGETTETTEYEPLEIDPALLSVICSELNLRRQASGQATITKDLIQVAEHQILSDFYERSLEGRNPAVRVFVEDELLTDKGYRDSYAFDDALGLPGITKGDLDSLVLSRLLRVDDRFGVRRLELTHDVLTHVVKESRDARKTREAEAAARAREQEAARRQRRNKIVSLALVMGIVIVIGAGLFVAKLWRQVDELNLQTMQRAKSLLLSHAKWFQPTQYDLALLLNLEAFKMLSQNRPLPSDDVKVEFASRFQSHPHLDAFLDGNDAMNSAVFSPDGRFLASAGADGRIILWDVKTRSSMGVFEGHNEPVFAVAFSPDGKRLASAGKDMAITIWDVATRSASLPPLKGHRDRILGVAFSPDGKAIASAGYDGKVILWSSTTGESLWKYEAEGTQHLAVAFSPTDKLLAVADADKTVLLLHSENGRVLETLKGHEDRVLNVAFSPNGLTLASASQDKTVILWDVLSARPIGEPLRKHDGAVWGVAFNSDGSLLATAGEDRKVIVWVLSGPKKPEPLDSMTLEGHLQAVRSVAFSPNGDIVASASDDHDAILWNLKESKLISRLDVRAGPVWAISFSPDGRRLVSASENNQVSVWDLAEARRSYSLPPLHDGPVMAVDFSPDGKLIATGGEDNSVILWDLAAGSPGNGINGRKLTGHSGPVLSVKFSPDGKLLASASGDQTVILWDTEKRERLDTLVGQRGAVRSVAFSRNGKLLASAGEGASVLVWDTATRKLLAELPTGLKTVYALAFSPDSRALASGGQGGGIALWNVAKGTPLNTLPGMSDPVRALAYSPDNRMLISAGQDGALHLWNASTGKHMSVLEGHSGRVLGLAFSPDGQTIASSGVDETVALRNWSLDSMAQLACRVANRNLTCSEWDDYVGGTYSKTCEGLPGPATPCP